MNENTVMDRREAIRQHANSIGIDDHYIDHLVETFYARVRADAVLGPVFDKAIGDNWPHHLSRMKDFWASVTMNAGRYSGKPVPAHQQHLPAIEEDHFKVWLDLFDRTLRETAPTTDAVDYFMERAMRIAESLKLAMFGWSGLGARP